MSEEIVSKQFQILSGNQKIYSYKDILEIMSEFVFIAYSDLLRS